VSAEAGAAADRGWDRAPHLLNSLWRYRWAVLAFALVSASAGYIYTAAQPPAFEATGRVTLTSPYDPTLFRNERGVPYVEITRYLNTQSHRMTSPDVLAVASELLEGRIQPARIRQMVEAQSSTTIFEVTVRARSDDPTEAADVANAVIQAYESTAADQVRARVEDSITQLDDFRAEIRERLKALSDEDDSDSIVQAEREKLSDELADLTLKAGQIRVDAAVFGAGIERVDPAVPPELPVSETPRRMAAVFGVLGFIAALILAFWRSERAQIIDNSDDAAGAVDAPLLGVVSTRPARTPGPAAAVAAVVTAPDSSEAREHQFIASKLALMGRESEPRVVLVTSPRDTAGKSVTALNLALSAALDQRTVILADLDPAGWLTQLLGAHGKCGVSDLIVRSSDGDVVVGDCVAVVDELSVVDGFRFIPVGGAAADGGATAVPQLAKLLARLLQEADLIVLDGPPLLRVPAGSRLAVDADSVVLVVGRGTTFEDVRKATGLIDLAKAPFVGYVFDRSRPLRSWWPWRRTESKSADRGSQRGPEGPVAGGAEKPNAQ
jgi:Mrp family chromosome partitioning ATPase/capsular polysaccharide biosynthesis protein